MEISYSKCQHVSVNIHTNSGGITRTRCDHYQLNYVLFHFVWDAREPLDKCAIGGLRSPL